LIFAGVFGLVTGAWLKEREMRRTIFVMCARWIYIPLVVLVLTGVYYSRVISAESFENLFHFNRESSPFITLIIVSSILLFGLGLFTLVRTSQSVQKIGAVLLVLICFGWMAGFEYLREIARKPFVLYGHMYSTGITTEEMESLNSEGFLTHAKWSEIGEVTDENMVEAGAEIFRLQCMACHTVDGYNGVQSRSDRLTERGLEAQLTGMGKVNSYMPPFAGTDLEKRAVAAYIYRVLQGKTTPPSVVHEAGTLPLQTPPFNPDSNDYVLLVWNSLGMHPVSDNEKYFSFQPPGNTLHAQLFKRGPLPEVITSGIAMEYRVEDGLKHPEYHSLFWEYDQVVFGVDLPVGTGLEGKGVSGTMEVEGSIFAANRIPVLPYMDDRIYNPYPMFTITARDESTGDMLAVTKAVAPTSTGMGCRNCHEGGWAWNDVSGMADLTAINILAVHDRFNGTTLLKDAEDGEPGLCQSCHADPVLAASGKPGVLNFSAAIHGFHANYLSGMDQEACDMCHPSGPGGNTRFFRGRHSDVGVGCTTCHGTLEDHALGLLANQPGIAAAERLSRGLEPVFAYSREEIEPRRPWDMEPDCRSCHTHFNIFEDGFAGTAFNTWTPGFEALYRTRSDNHGVMCAACHGSPHAVYGTQNMYGLQRDNQQPLQYQGLAGTIGTHGQCMVCHTIEMTVNGHHRNMVNRDPLPAIVE
jgi:hypothetical protein